MRCYILTFHKNHVGCRMYTTDELYIHIFGVFAVKLYGMLIKFISIDYFKIQTILLINVHSVEANLSEACPATYGVQWSLPSCPIDILHCR